MDVQFIDVRAVRSVLRKELCAPLNYIPAQYRRAEYLMYVMSRCPAQGPGHVYGTLPWNEAHATRFFRESCQRRKAA